MMDLEMLACRRADREAVARLPPEDLETLGLIESLDAFGMLRGDIPEREASADRLIALGVVTERGGVLRRAYI